MAARGFAFTTLVLVLAALPLATDGKKQDKETSWRMSHHSFAKTLSYDNTLGDWVSSAATMALRDRVQLLPPVPDRYGILWNKQPVRSGKFEVTFTLSGTPKDGKEGPNDAVVAFWIGLKDWAASYSEQDIVTKSKSWNEGLNSAGLTFAVNRPNFHGLGLLFLGKDRAKSNRQSVTALWGDGTKVYDQNLQNVPEAPGATTKYIDWLTIGTQVKLKVNARGGIEGFLLTSDVKDLVGDTQWSYMEDGVNSNAFLSLLADGRIKVNDGDAAGSWKVLPGHRLRLWHPDKLDCTMRLEGELAAVQEDPKRSPLPSMTFVGKLNPTPEEVGKAPEEKWVQIFNLPDNTFPSGAPECFIGFTGWTGSNSWAEVNLHQLQMLNQDPSTIGEKDQDVLGALDAQWSKVLASTKRFVDQASQKDAVERLSQLLGEHVKQYNEMGEKLKSDIVNMEARLDNLGKDMGTYHAATQSFNMESNSFDSDVVRQHIGGIRSIFEKDKASDKYHGLHRAAKELKAKHTAQALNEKGKAKVQTVADQAKDVEEMAERGSTQTNSLFLVMVVCVMVVAMLFLNRMRYYEKKHFI